MKTARNMVIGLRTGLLLGAIFSAWAGVMFLMNGGRPMERYNNVTFIEVAGGYLFGGAVGGVIIGALYPLVRYKVGALLVGMLAVLPFAVAVMGSLQGFSPWTGGHTFVVCVMTLVLGGVVGGVLHSD